MRPIWAAHLATNAALLAGCAQAISGAAEGSSVQPVTSLRPGDAGQILVPAARVSDIVGSRLQVDADRVRPVTGASAVPACSALDSVGMAAFVGERWSGFRVLFTTEGDRHGRVVSQAVAVYPDASLAATVFRAGTSDVRLCDGQRALGTGSDAAWKIAVQDGTTDTVRWTKRQLSIPLTWVCHGEARLRNNAVLQAMACQGDDGGQTVVTTLTDRMSASVWELSGR